MPRQKDVRPIGAQGIPGIYIYIYMCMYMYIYVYLILEPCVRANLQAVSGTCARGKSSVLCFLQQHS